MEKLETALPSVDVVSQVEKEWYRKVLGGLVERGVAPEKIQEKRETLRNSFVTFALGTIPESLGYDRQATIEILKMRGYDDVFDRLDFLEAGESLHPDALLQKAKENVQLGAIKPDELPEDATLLDRFLHFFARTQLQSGLSHTASSEVLSVAPAVVSTAVQGVERIPVFPGTPGIPNPAFDPRVKEEGFSKSVDKKVFRVPGYDFVGVDTAEELGVPHWLADLLAQDLLDPAGWALGKPLLLLAGAGLGGAALKGPSVVRFLRAAAEKGVKMSGDELLELHGAVAKGLEKELLATKGINVALTPSSSDILTVKPYLMGGLKPRAARATGKAVDFLAKEGTHVARTRLRRDREFIKMLNSVWKKTKSPVLLNELVALRTRLADGAEELAKWNTSVSQGLSKDAFENLETNALRRRDIKDVFYNTKTGKFVEVEAGLMAEMQRRPELFLNSKGAYKKNRLGRLAEKLGLADESESLRHFGYRSKSVMEAAAGIETIRKVDPGQLVDPLDFIPVAGKIIREGFQPAMRSLERTPAFRPIVMAQSAAAAERAFVMDRVNVALGGTVHRVGDALSEILFAGGRKVRWGERSPLIKRQESIWRLGLNRTKTLLKPESHEVIDQKNMLAILMGDSFHEAAVEAQRLKAKLPKLPDPREFPEEIKKAAANLRAILDDLHAEAAKWGIISPDLFRTQYLPRIIKELDSGKSMDEAFRSVVGAFTNKQRIVKKQLAPFFAEMSKMQNPHDLLTDPVELIDLYAKSLYRAKYVDSAVDDLVLAIANPKLSLSPKDRMLALEFIRASTGGTTQLELAVARAQSLWNANIISEVGDQEFLAKLNELTDTPKFRNAQRWFVKQFADIAHTMYIGGQALKAARNQTQVGLGIPLMGGPVRGWQHLLNGKQRIAKDAALRSRFFNRARKYNWFGEFLDFMDKSFEELPPGIISQSFKKIWMALYQLSDMQNRMDVWAGAFDFAEKAFKEGDTSWRKLAQTFPVEEKGTLERLFRAGDEKGFVELYADAAVNNSQWLYNARNRPLFFQKNPVWGVALVFQTWPLNYAATLTRAVGGRGIGEAHFDRSDILPRMMKNGIDYMMPSIVIGAALEGGGRLAGYPGMSRWLFPEVGEFGGTGKAVKKWMGADDDENVIIPLPLHGVTGLGNVNIISAARDLGTAAEMFLSAFLNDEPETAARAWEHGVDAFPVVPGALRVVSQEFGKALGIDPDVEFRDGAFEQALGAILEVSGGDAPLGERVLRSAGAPKKKDRTFIWPFETP